MKAAEMNLGVLGLFSKIDWGGGGATVSGSPGRAEQGVAGVPPGIGTYGCQGTSCQAVKQVVQALVVKVCRVEVCNKVF